MDMQKVKTLATHITEVVRAEGERYVAEEGYTYSEVLAATAMFCMAGMRASQRLMDDRDSEG